MADKVASYFNVLGGGSATISDFHDFKNNLGIVINHYPAPNLVRQFWNASRASSMLSVINPESKSRMTRYANIYLAENSPELELRIDDPALKTEDLEKLLEIYIHLQTMPPASFIEKWLSVAGGRLDEMSPLVLKNVPKKLAELGIYPGDEWIKKWWDVAKPQTRDWAQEDGYDVLYRMTLLDFLRTRHPKDHQPETSPCKEIACGFLDFLQKSAKYFFKKTIDRRIFLAAKWFQYDFIDQFQVSPETHVISRGEGIFSHHLSRAHLNVNEEGLIISGLNHRIDVAIENDGFAGGAQVDGLPHFHRMTLPHPTEEIVALNTSTRFMSELIARFSDYRVLRVPYFYNKISDDNLPWEEVFTKLAEKNAGVYTYHGDTNIKNMSDKSGHLFRNQPL